MALTPFVYAPFGTPGRNAIGEQSSTELSFVRNFDITKPAVMVFFAHGHRVMLERDVVRRQAVLAQLEKAGLNAVLVAPQLAYNATGPAGDSPGRFAEPGFATKFFEEAAQKLAQMHDQQRHNLGRPKPETLDTFRKMPIIVTSYSGGYGAANAVIEESMRAVPLVHMGAGGQLIDQPSLGQRIKGAVLLDTLYGGSDTYRRFASQTHRPFVVSNYIPTNGRNLTHISNTVLHAHFSATGQLTTGTVNARQNVKIYHATSGDHVNLVQDTLTRSLGYIPGYRVADVVGPAVARTTPTAGTAQYGWRMHRHTPLPPNTG
ncbi:MAG: hypothetical protein SFW65_10085 [Alphaproteobacteria bacterium]|nr:hypothetical protein [Alphaproteobacteria bacterium]